MVASSLSPSDPANTLKWAVRCRAIPMLRRWAAALMLAQSALSGLVDRAADTIVARCPPGRDAPAPRPSAGVAELPTSTAVMAIAISVGLGMIERFLPLGACRSGTLQPPRVATG